MAQKCPSNMLRRNSAGDTPLHYVCWALVHHRVNIYLSEVCKYLIEHCPESVRESNDNGWLPIHYLFDSCQHLDVVAYLLREYPESYDMVPEFAAAPSSFPWNQRIKLLLDEERELKENIAYLKEVSGVFRGAVDDTQTPSQLAGSTCDVFVNWATVIFVQRLEAKMEQVSMQLQHECNVDEEEDDDEDWIINLLQGLL